MESRPRLVAGDDATCSRHVPPASLSLALSPSVLVGTVRLVAVVVTVCAGAQADSRNAKDQYEPRA